MYTAIISLGGQNISFNLAFVRRFVVLQFTAIKLLYSVVNVYFHQEEPAVFGTIIKRLYSVLKDHGRIRQQKLMTLKYYTT